MAKLIALEAFDLRDEELNDTTIHIESGEYEAVPVRAGSGQPGQLLEQPIHSWLLPGLGGARLVRDEFERLRDAGKIRLG